MVCSTVSGSGILSGHLYSDIQISVCIRKPVFSLINAVWLISVLNAEFCLALRELSAMCCQPGAALHSDIL